MKKTLIYILLIIVALLSVSSITIYLTQRKPLPTCPIGEIAIRDCNCQYDCVDKNIYSANEVICP